MRFELSDLKTAVLVALIVTADQLSKMWVMAVFSLYESKVVIPGFFNLTYITNPGAAFGFLAGAHGEWRQLFFVGVALVAVTVLVCSYRHFKGQGMVFALAIGLIMGGALGNLIDRLRFGAVVDFLDFYFNNHHWPAFNVADSAITVGVALFLLGSLLQHRCASERQI